MLSFEEFKEKFRSGEYGEDNMDRSCRISIEMEIGKDGYPVDGKFKIANEGTYVAQCGALSCILGYIMLTSFDYMKENLPFLANTPKATEHMLSALEVPAKCIAPAAIENVRKRVERAEQGK